MPNLFTRIFGGQAAIAETKATRMLVSWADLGLPEWTRRSFPALAQEGFAKNPVVHRCVRLLAESANRVPMVVVEGGKRLSDQPLLTLLRRPNPYQSGSELLEAVYAYLQTAGNAYLNAVMTDGQVSGLYSLRPDRMQAGPPISVRCPRASPTPWRKRVRSTVPGTSRRARSMLEPYVFGTQTDATRELQAALVRLGISPGPIDGVFGRQTRDAVAAARQRFGLPAAGGVDAILLAQLGLGPNPNPLGGLILGSAAAILLSQLKGRFSMTFLSGYKTYIIAGVMLLVGLAGVVGIDIPSFTGQAPGNLVMEALAFFFLRQGLKTGGTSS